MTNPPDRDELASMYLDQLEFEPYSVQEEALLTWFTSNDHGVLVCAPTGTGKTLIAEAALFEALHTGKKAYYTTPLIALTEQKLQDLRASAVRWGFRADDIGLVTGNRRVNPDAPILVVVAEILFNRLLRKDQFNFDDVSAVVMDEFHSFNDQERGVVWEFSLGLMPEHVRLMLLSATIGNAMEFTSWTRRSFKRRIELVQSEERKVPLTFRWIDDQLLTEHLESMAQGSEEGRLTPALVFCFNRDECWNVAEQLKGKKLLQGDMQAKLSDELQKHDWSQGVGPKLKQILQRGVGVHHAGLMPRYKRIVESMFQQKLLSVTVCTETLAAGINLPARSVVIPNLLKGPRDDKKLIEASAAHQMFGRAGRPQFDKEGFVFSLAHEDDVKILRWKEKYDQIPEDTKDPQLRKAKKALKKKMPTRRANQAYWTEAQFEKLRTSPASNLESRGSLPWRLLGHILEASPDVDAIMNLVDKRLMPLPKIDNAKKSLDRMLKILWNAGYVTLEPEPPKHDENSAADTDAESKEKKEEAPAPATLFGAALSKPPEKPKAELATAKSQTAKTNSKAKEDNDDGRPPAYRAKFAYPTDQLAKLALLRGVNPLFGIFAINHLGIANREERIQVFESILDMPGTVARYVRVPRHEEMPPGPLATTRLDSQLLQLGLATPEELGAADDKDDDDDDRRFGEERVFVLTIAEKLRLLFNHDFPGVQGVRITSVWAAGEIMQFGDFNNFVTSKRLQKQEGILFRHLLRLLLVIGEFEQLCPPETTPEEWRQEINEIRERLVGICKKVDPATLDSTLEAQASIDIV